MTHVAVSEERIFHHPVHRHAEVPTVDLLTLLFGLSLRVAEIEIEQLLTSEKNPSMALQLMTQSFTSKLPTRITP